MLDYSTLFSAASQLPVTDRMRLIDALAATLPKDHPASAESEYERLAIADAVRDLKEHPDEVRQALQRRGGVTTEQLLRNCHLAAERAAN